MNTVPKGRIALYVIGGFVAAILLGVGLMYLTGNIQKETAGFRGEVDATETIQADGSFRIAAYDGFFDRCGAVQADESRRDALIQELATTEPGSKRATQINASLTAIRAARAEKIAQYNADASKDWTVGQFRSEGLPYKLNVNDENTECAL